MNQLIAFLPLIAVMGVFLYFSSRRQRKALDATIKLHDSLAVGDRVYTTAGLQGTITALTDDTVDLEIATGVVTRWMKLAIREKIEDQTSDATTGGIHDAEGAGVELTKE